MNTLSIKRPAPRSVDEELKDIVSVLAIKWGVAEPQHFYRAVEIYNRYLAGLTFAKHRDPVKLKKLVVGQFQTIQANGAAGKGLTTNEYGHGVLLGMYASQLHFWKDQAAHVWERAVAEINRFTEEAKRAN